MYLNMSSSVVSDAELSSSRTHTTLSLRSILKSRKDRGKQQSNLFRSFVPRLLLWYYAHYLPETNASASLSSASAPSATLSPSSSTSPATSTLSSTPAASSSSSSSPSSSFDAPHQFPLHAAVLFADVSGFTAMTAELAKKGKQTVLRWQRLCCVVLA